MILNDRHIINNNLITEHFNKKCLTPNGYDLRVKEIEYKDVNTGRWKKVDNKKIPLSNQRFKIKTMEYLKLPDDVIGKLWTRTYWGKRGVMSEYGLVDAGFEGRLYLNFYTFEDIFIEPKDRITQIAFEKIKMPDKNYEQRSGNHQRQR